MMPTARNFFMKCSPLGLLFLLKFHLQSLCTKFTQCWQQDAFINLVPLHLFAMTMAVEEMGTMARNGIVRMIATVSLLLKEIFPLPSQCERTID